MGAVQEVMAQWGRNLCGVPYRQRKVGGAKSALHRPLRFIRTSGGPGGSWGAWRVPGGLGGLGQETGDPAEQRALHPTPSTCQGVGVQETSFDWLWTQGAQSLGCTERQVTSEIHPEA